MRYGRRDDLVLEYRNAWTAWGNTYPTTEVLREQGFYTALDPAFWTDMYGNFAWVYPNDVQIVFSRAAYVDDTYMCWLHDGFEVADGYMFLSGDLDEDELGSQCTWNQTSLVRGEIDAE